MGRFNSLLEIDKPPSPSPDAAPSPQAAPAPLPAPDLLPKEKPQSNGQANTPLARAQQAGEEASEQAGEHASMLADIRKTIRQVGKETAYVRLTKEEKQQLADIVYTHKRQGVRTSENEICRIAISFLIEDYHACGQASILARMLEALYA